EASSALRTTPGSGWSGSSLSERVTLRRTPGASPSPTGSCATCPWSTWTTPEKHRSSRSMGPSTAPCSAWCLPSGRMPSRSRLPWSSSTSCLRRAS
ncbi:unnamed protein product, partial [Ixodes pacificus]